MDYLKHVIILPQFDLDRLLSADRATARSLSSAGALLGLIGVAIGFPWADGLAGLVVTAFIVRVGWEVTSEVVVHLMDGVDPAVLASVEAAALTVSGIRHVHARGRWSGRSLIIEVEGWRPRSER
jgi:divalent metal cation (Fe/Co/Zn/Cd) transporter